MCLCPTDNSHSYGIINKKDRLEKIIEKSEIKNDQYSESLCNTGIMK